MSTIKPNVKESPRSKGKIFLIFGIVIVFLYIIGFGGTWVYFHTLKQKSIPTTASQSISLPPSFAVLDTIKIHTDDEAIEAVKSTRPDLRDVSKFSKNESGIVARAVKDGWKLRITKTSGACSQELDGCEDLYIYYFVVYFDGTIKKVGEFELHVDIHNPESRQRNGTRIPDFFTNDDLYQ